MVHCRHHTFSHLADRLRPTMPYLTAGIWDDLPGITGRNRIPLNRLFVPLRNGIEPVFATIVCERYAARACRWSGFSHPRWYRSGF